MSTRLHGWSAMQERVGLLFGVFQTRQELIQYQCWNLGEISEPLYAGGSLCPWTHADSAEVSKTWRRIKRKYGLRAVRMVVMPAEEAGNG